MVVTSKQAPRTKQRRATATGNVAKTMLDKASLTLAELPEKTKETLSMKEAVKFLAEPITTAIAKGYSQEDIAVLLSKEGIEITPASLKYYLAQVQPKAKQGKGKVRKPRQTRGKSVETSSPTSVETPSFPSPPVDSAPDSVTTEAAPVTKGRKSTKSKTTQTAAKTKPATAVETTVASPKASKTTSEAPAKPKRSPRSTTKAAKAPAQAKSTTRRATAQNKTKTTGTKRTSKSKAK